MRILEGDSFNLLNFSRSIAVSSSGIICLLVTVIFVAEKLRPTNINTLPIFLNGEGNGNLLQYSCLENPLDRGTWQAIVHGVARVGHNWVTRERERERDRFLKVDLRPCGWVLANGNVSGVVSCVVCGMLELACFLHHSFHSSARFWKQCIENEELQNSWNQSSWITG